MLNQKILMQLVEYCPETGVMKWRKRDVSFFKSDHSCRSWNTKYTGKEALTLDGKGYRVITIFTKRYLVHRLAWLYVHGVWPKIIDHLNGNKTDNRLANLREVSSQGNHLNMRKASNNTSGVTGVYLNARKNLWCAQMKFNGITYHLGSSKNFEEAVAMRKAEESRLGFSIRHGGRDNA